MTALPLDGAQLNRTGRAYRPATAAPCVLWRTVFRPQSINSLTNKKGNKQMKLTKTQIKEKRSELVAVLLKIEKLKDEKTNTVKVPYARIIIQRRKNEN